MTDMGMTRRVALVALGAILIVAFVIVWKYVTGIMTLFVENFWCSTFEKTDVCHFRGYQHFLIWTVIGIINLLIIMTLYGVFIPNDPKDTARVVLTMALGPFLTLVALKLKASESSAIRRRCA